MNLGQPQNQIRTEGSGSRTAPTSSTCDALVPLGRLLGESRIVERFQSQVVPHGTTAAFIRIVLPTPEIKLSCDFNGASTSRCRSKLRHYRRTPQRLGDVARPRCG